jgi:hypothetical protein
MPGPEFHRLAERSNINRLMALNTTNVVVGWSKAIICRFAFAEDEFIIFESSISSGGRRFWFGDAFIDWGAACAEVIEEVIGFGVHVSSESFGGRLTFYCLRNAEG